MSNGFNNLHPTKVIIDEKTGEVEYMTNKEYIQYLDSKNRHVKTSSNSIEYIKSKEEFAQYIDESCGNFYFNYYNSYQVNQYTFRLIYLCTFMNYQGYIEFGNSKGINKLASKKDLIEILGLSKAESYNTINYLFDNGLIIEDGEYIRINSDVCIKGKIKNKKEVVRMFDNAIKEIYENSMPKEHKKLSLLIKLLPYIHYDKNVICENPSEQNEEFIIPVNLTQLTTILGYSTTQKLRKGLMNLKANNEFVIMLSKINNKDMIVVNPKVYYKGNKLNEMKGIISLFAMAK